MFIILPPDSKNFTGSIYNFYQKNNFPVTQDYQREYLVILFFLALITTFMVSELWKQYCVFFVWSDYDLMVGYLKPELETEIVLVSYYIISMFIELYNLGQNHYKYFLKFTS